MTPTRIFNFGSVNIDHIYAVPHFVRPGETLAAQAYRRGPGGKGFNQSVALARAGAATSHIGCIGDDGLWLRDFLAAEGVDVSALRTCDEATGHAIIQVAPSGENNIILHPGANRVPRVGDVEAALRDARPGDFFLCQNETSAVVEALALARSRGLRCVCNAAPAVPILPDAALRAIDILLVNETEMSALGGAAEPREALRHLRIRYPQLGIVLTLGAEGCLVAGPAGEHSLPAQRVKAIDTTAAGDTFAGYLLAALAEGADMPAALTLATRAAALCVTRPGAATSIPRRDEL